MPLKFLCNYSHVLIWVTNKVNSFFFFNFFIFSLIIPFVYISNIITLSSYPNTKPHPTSAPFPLPFSSLRVLPHPPIPAPLLQPPLLCGITPVVLIVYKYNKKIVNSNSSLQTDFSISYPTFHILSSSVFIFWHDEAVFL